ncbi:hypothetical protein F8M41_024350 [Gigaspora margarita]|uniref:Uncharacterized protein n=1 Tax=Gigaspora margarita TaxID=4874 RepID=A0A8H3XP41_GIGMA|nr:hypothetical protein F8M41_024350 [Gigaspora margarita]
MKITLNILKCVLQILLDSSLFLDTYGNIGDNSGIGDTSSIGDTGGTDASDTGDVSDTGSTGNTSNTIGASDTCYYVVQSQLLSIKPQKIPGM